MSAVSRMGLLLHLIVREDRRQRQERAAEHRQKKKPNSAPLIQAQDQAQAQAHAIQAQAHADDDDGNAHCEGLELADHDNDNDDDIDDDDDDDDDCRYFRDISVEDLLPELPPIFDGCTRILDPRHQIEARDAYWDATQITTSAAAAGVDGEEEDRDRLEKKREELLRRACDLNPWIAEPHVLLAQIHASRAEFPAAARAARRALTLLLQWGTCWDKRVSWEAWIAWTRVLLSAAEAKTWPNSAWGILNLGLVK
jgi:hypothetical protein